MAGYNPLDQPSSAALLWFRTMQGAAPTRNSNNSTDATEKALDACLIPVGVGQLASQIEIWTSWRITNNNASTKVLTLRGDANPVSAPTTGGVAIVQTTQTTNLSGSLTAQARCNNSLASQDIVNTTPGVLGGVFTTTDLATIAVDFSTDRNITFCARWSANQAVAESIKLASWIVKVYR